MSDTMLLSVLRMPHALAMADELSRLQCWSRAAEAADRIETDADRIAELEARLDWTWAERVMIAASLKDYTFILHGYRISDLQAKRRLEIADQIAALKGET